MNEPVRKQKNATEAETIFKEEALFRFMRERREKADQNYSNQNKRKYAIIQKKSNSQGFKQKSQRLAQLYFRQDNLIIINKVIKWNSLLLYHKGK
ncbi:unnamed protein product [Paramecium sonneborni]|uniref:Uncharacterized protein n=1 Tax=Paramecium sonneborni TaxID=65129 RepID=A0A8S1NA41_9CILI|nr:unnamed protein product [Paramecium sonneborni]